MRLRLGLVGGTGKAGVKTATSRLLAGLALEGVRVTEILPGNHLLQGFVKDIHLTRNLSKYDVLLYSGVIPWTSHLPAGGCRRGLFVHGFVQDELVLSIQHEKLTRSLPSIIQLGRWGVFRHLNGIDFVLAHSISAYESARFLNSKPVLLPQFLLDNDFQAHSRAGHMKLNRHDPVRILTYTSLAESPRLLSREQIEYLTTKLRERIGRNLEFIVIGAPGTNFGNAKFLNLLKQDDFFKLLSSCDLYLELCTDEELRYGSLEAGILGVPVAKVSRPECVGRQDYTSEEVLVGRSIGELIDKVTTYLDDVENQRTIRGKEYWEFLSHKRRWDVVKGPLIEAIT